MTERDPRWSEYPCTFTCEPLLFVLGNMLPRSHKTAGPTVAEDATRAARRLATETSREVQLVDDRHLLVMMDEPFEAVSIARTHDLAPKRCIASGLALELLREPGDTWTWLCGQLEISDEPAYRDGLVKLPGIDRFLPAGATEIPPGAGVWLWLLEGNGDDRLVFVDRPQVIGRKRPTGGPEIAVDDKAMSSQHALVGPHRGTWAIHDHQSLSGTWHEGHQIRSRSLVPGQVFHVGQSQLVVLSVR